MFRLYDTRKREAAEIQPARTGLLRLHLESAGPARPAHLGDLRSYVLADLIRRNAERHGGSVVVCQDAGDAGSLSGADRTALCIAPPDFDCAAPSAPGAGNTVDVGVGLAGIGAEAANARGEHGSDAEATLSASHGGVRYWVEGGRVLFDGQEMSAPGSNAPTANAVLLADISARGLDPLAVRLAFLGHRYRDQLNLTWDLIGAADAEARRWRELVATWANEPSKPICAGYWSRFAGALDDDLDTPAALAVMRELAADSEIPAGSRFETFAAGDRVLGLELVSLVGKLPA